ncbi:MAG TPA: ankyrin repeat domain-containing protein [Candidatus Acidoferrales bacterium]|nr:ankyrin repeat domain-containing protein [Candidatus Acidoferrales bacterium]
MPGKKCYEDDSRSISTRGISQIWCAMASRPFVSTLVTAMLACGLAVLASCGATETSPPRPQPTEAQKKELLATNELLTACTARDIAKVKALLEKNPSLINAEDDIGATPLARAVGGLQPNEQLVKLLLEKGAKVEGSAKSGETPLQIAALRGKKEIVALLLAHGANVHAHSRYGSSVMDFAAFQNQKKVADLLLAKGAEMTISDASALGDIKKMEEILHREPGSVREFDSRGFTPLHWAALHGHRDAVRLLLANGASAFEGNRLNGATPCTIAREFKRTEIIELMRCP